MPEQYLTNKLILSTKAPIPDLLEAWRWLVYRYPTVALQTYEPPCQLLPVSLLARPNQGMPNLLLLPS